ISGPINALVIEGPIALQDVTVTGFDLAARLGTIASFAGLPKTSETSILTLNATVRATPEGTWIDDLNLVIPAIGKLTGSGTINTHGAIDFRMLAKPSGSRVVVNGSVLVASLGNGVPFRIQGTTSNPTFAPDMGRAVGSVVRSPQTAGKAA